ncbi:MAG: TonB family protein [Vicinamibacteria bacterium]|nr:TonB family protein [Vicinamibacteria bacterium]
MKEISPREAGYQEDSSCSPMDDSTQYVEQMPERIGRYEIKSCLGFGAMGAVYRAFDPLIKRTLAIKTIRLDIPRQSPQYKSFIERFYHEARISGTLSHPNIVTLYDIGEESGVPFLAMEFADGETISAMIEHGVRFTPERVAVLVSQIASALDYAHGKGVIHRDIKPSNLILCEEDRVKVTDFGIAKLADAELTQSGMLLGTPAYMSPEQAMGDKLDGRSDIFSLGICAFEMLSGEQPFPGNNVTAILYKVVNVEPVEPANLEVLGLLPDKWREVFNRALAKKPDDRYQTASAFVQGLEYCLGSWFGLSMGEETAQLAAPAEAIESTEAMPSLPDDGETGAAMEALSAVENDASSSITSAPAPSIFPDDVSRDKRIDKERVVAAPPSPPSPDSDATSIPEAPESQIENEPIVVAPPSPDPDATPIPTLPESQIENEPIVAAPPSPDPDATPIPTLPQLQLESDEEPTLLMPSALADETETIALSAVSAKAVNPGDSAQSTLPENRMATTPPPLVEPRKTTARPPAQSQPSTSSAMEPKRRITQSMPSSGRSPRATASIRKPVARSRPLAPAPAHVFPKRRSSIRLGKSWIVASATGATLLLVAGGFLGLRFLSANRERPRSLPDPATVVTPMSTPPTPSRGTLRVLSTPLGADVYINGKPRGTTPLVLTLPLGLYDVRISMSNLAPQPHKVELSSEQPMVELHARFRIRSSGLATIVTDPTGASITLDGRTIGKTPIHAVKLDAGERVVEIRLEGYQVLTRRINVVADQRQEFSYVLDPIVIATPSRLVVDTERVYFPQDVDIRPKKLSGPHPDYPDARKLKAGEAVSVTVSFVIDADGSVSGIEVSESGGAALDKAAVNALKEWRFEPGVKRETRVRVRESRRFTFKSG